MRRCEALVLSNGRYVPCGRPDAQLHHKLTRARGGLILDRYGEDYHLMNLCVKHHAHAHDSDTAYDGGLLIRGSVISTLGGRPVYTGPDEFLSKKYPQP